MHIEQNIERVMECFEDPYIKERMARDGSEFKCFKHPAISYLSAGIFGYFILIRTLNTEMEVHALLREEAAVVSRDLVKNMVKWVFENTDVNRISAPVSNRLTSVVNLCKKCGFTVDGVMRQQELKGGKLFDVTILSILRGEHVVD
jgi:hypothetical protein